MATDWYTRVMLTIIALCLVWLSLGGPSLIGPVRAENAPQDVVIAGFKAVPGGTMSELARGLPVRSK